MKTIYVTDLQKNMIIANETFVICSVEKAEDKNGKAYYKLTLGDKTGKISSKIWSDKLAQVESGALKEGNVVQISAKVEEYRGSFQLNVMSLNSVDEGALDEFLESSEYNPDEMFDELLKEVESISHKGLREVLNTILADAEISRRFKYWPAAATVHHDFRSGLLQHVLEMLTFSKGIVRFYPDINYDILKAGIIMHDMGKIYELDATGVSTSYTKIGTLVGHIVIGTQIFTQYAKGNLPEDVYIHVIHLILSHHGSFEFGCPVLPSTVEATVLTYLDNLSAKARTAAKARKNITEGQSFSSNNNWLGGARIWKGGDYESLPTPNIDVDSISQNNQEPKSIEDSIIDENLIDEDGQLKL